MSRRDVAARIGVSERSIAALERGKGRVSTLVRLEPLVAIEITGLRRANSVIEAIVLTRASRGWGLRETATRSGLAINTLRSLERGIGSTSALIRLIYTLSPNARTRASEPKSGARCIITVARARDPDRHPEDYYATPAPVVRLLLDAEELTRDHPILEPAVGEARTIDTVLRERGYRTVCFDINGQGAERKSFFDVGGPHHTIVTNPPWKLHAAFIQHAKQIATHKIVFLMPLNYLTGATRHEDIWTDTSFPLARVHVLNRGIDFQNSDPNADRFRPAQVYSAWYVFERGHFGSPALNWINSNSLVARKSG